MTVVPSELGAVGGAEGAIGGWAPIPEPLSTGDALGMGDVATGDSLLLGGTGDGAIGTATLPCATGGEATIGDAVLLDATAGDVAIGCAMLLDAPGAAAMALLEELLPFPSAVKWPTNASSNVSPSFEARRRLEAFERVAASALDILRLSRHGAASAPVHGKYT